MSIELLIHNRRRRARRPINGEAPAIRDLFAAFAGCGSADGVYRTLTAVETVAAQRSRR
jgi:hypothetical protein